MSKPVIHSRSSVKKYGGVIDDYIKIHTFLDSSKSAISDVRHRAIFHSAFGIFIVQQVFGEYFINSEGKYVSVRDIAEDHILEDLGFIPTAENYLNNMKVQDWMSGSMRNRMKDSYKKLGRNPNNALNETEDAPYKLEKENEYEFK